MTEMYQVTVKELKLIKKLCDLNTPLTRQINNFLMHALHVHKDVVEQMEKEGMHLKKNSADK